MEAIQYSYHKSICTEEEIDKLFNALENDNYLCKLQEIIIRDQNAKVGREQLSEIVGKYGFESWNLRGEK